MANMAPVAIESLYVSESKGLPRVRIPLSPPIHKPLTNDVSHSRRSTESGEDGILYAHVRVCLIEEGGDPATCEGTTRNLFVEQTQPAAVTRAKEEIWMRLASAPSRANLPALNPALSSACF